MKVKAVSCGALLLFGALSLSAQSPDPQQKAAAAKEAAARNQQALRSYSWITKTDLLLKGEVKNTKIESCQYGPDGKVHKTQLSLARKTRPEGDAGGDVPVASGRNQLRGRDGDVDSGGQD
jgi:hypothetical protein